MPKRSGLKLDDKTVRDLPLPAKGMQMIFDTMVTGFGVRLTAGGARSYVVSYSVAGRERRYTIGDTKTWTCASARKYAADIRAGARLGKDPLAELDEARQAQTMADLCDRFETDYLPKLRPNTRDQYKRAIHGTDDRKGIRAHFKKTRVDALTYSDVEGYHRQVSKAAPMMANRILAVLSKMMSLAVRWQMATVNVVKSVDRNQETKRTRYLTLDEITALTKALAALPDRQAATIFTLLLWTGARKTEVLSMRWDDLDLDAGRWVKPGATTKQRTEHRVPLSAAAIDLLRGIERKGPFVFPGKVEGQHRQNVKHQWAVVAKAAGLPTGEIVIHTLRHSVASVLVSSGLSLPIVGAMLGHTQAQTTQRYAHLMDDPLREASERVASIMGAGR